MANTHRRTIRATSSQPGGAVPRHPTSTTPAASASSPTSRAAARTPSCARRSTCSSTSSTAAPPAPTPTPATAPASWSRCPTASCARVAAVPLPPAGRLRRRPGVPAARRRGARASCARWSSGSPPRKARRCSAGARCRPTSTAVGAYAPPPSRPAFEQVFIAARRDAGRSPTPCARFERTLYVIRKRVEHAVEDRGGADARPAAAFYIVSLSAKTLIYKGMLTASQIGRMFPDLARSGRRVGAGARAPALLHQHVPVVAARASVPLRRAQRRDQHAARQHQLDAGARRAAPVERVRRRTAPRSCRSSAPAAATRRPSTTCSSSW